MLSPVAGIRFPSWINGCACPERASSSSLGFQPEVLKFRICMRPVGTPCGRRPRSFRPQISRWSIDLGLKPEAPSQSCFAAFLRRTWQKIAIGRLYITLEFKACAYAPSGTGRGKLSVESNIISGEYSVLRISTVFICPAPTVIRQREPSRGAAPTMPCAPYTNRSSLEFPGRN